MIFILILLALTQWSVLKADKEGKPCSPKNSISTDNTMQCNAFGVWKRRRIDGAGMPCSHINVFSSDHKLVCNNAKVWEKVKTRRHTSKCVFYIRIIYFLNLQIVLQFNIINNSNTSTLQF